MKWPHCACGHALTLKKKVLLTVVNQKKTSEVQKSYGIYGRKIIESREQDRTQSEHEST